MSYTRYFTDLRVAIDRLESAVARARARTFQSHWWMTFSSPLRDRASRLRGPRMRRSVEL